MDFAYPGHVGTAVADGVILADELRRDGRLTILAALEVLTFRSCRPAVGPSTV